MEHKLSLIKLTNLIAKMETTFNVDCDEDWDIETYFAFEGTEFEGAQHKVGLLALPEHAKLIFTDAPHSAAAELYNVDLNEEGRNITWALVFLDE